MDNNLDQPERCEICEEPIAPFEEIAEMFHPDWTDDMPSVICHAQCGLWKGLIPA